MDEFSKCRLCWQKNGRILQVPALWETQLHFEHFITRNLLLGVPRVVLMHFLPHSITFSIWSKWRNFLSAGPVDKKCKNTMFHFEHLIILQIPMGVCKITLMHFWPPQFTWAKMFKMAEILHVPALWETQLHFEHFITWNLLLGVSRIVLMHFRPHSITFSNWSKWPYFLRVGPVDKNCRNTN
jgi:hypothetical protein